MLALSLHKVMAIFSSAVKGFLTIYHLHTGDEGEVQYTENGTLVSQSKNFFSIQPHPIKLQCNLRMYDFFPSPICDRLGEKGPLRGNVNIWYTTKLVQNRQFRQLQIIASL